MSIKNKTRSAAGILAGLVILFLSARGLFDSQGDKAGSFSSGLEMAQDIAVDPDGNVYVTGYGSDRETHFDFVTLKYDAEGNLVWANRYNGPAGGSDYAQALELDDEGSVYVVGHCNGLNTSLDATVVKYDKDGPLLWARHHDGTASRDDWAYDVARAVDGGVVVAGYSFGRGTEHDYMILKYSADGDLLWSARHNPPFNRDDVCQKLVLDKNGNVYVTGIDRTRQTAYDMATLKYDAGGRLNWLARYAGPAQAYDAAADIAVDPDGNVFVTGYSFMGETEYDVVTLKYDAGGREIWRKTYDGPSHLIDCGMLLAVMPEGRALVAGTSLDPETGADCFLIQYDAGGNQAWISRYNGPGNGADVPQALAVDTKSNIILAGYSRGAASGRDYCLVKYDRRGHRLWVQRYDSGSSDEDVLTAMTVDPQGFILVTGCGYSPQTAFDYITQKYDPDGRLLWTARYPEK